MTVPDYPLLTPGGYEMYQLAQIATFIADRLTHHRRSARGLQGWRERVAAVRDIAGAATALDSVLGSTTAMSRGLLPRPLDRATYERARELVVTEPRSAHVVALPDAGGWAVVGTVPGLGPVGAYAPTSQVAEAIRSTVLGAPVDALQPWVVIEGATSVPALPDSVDLASFVNHLDPERAGHREVAIALRGNGRTVDAAIRSRFAETPTPAPAAAAAADPAPTRAAAPGRAGGAAARKTSRLRPRPPRSSSQPSATAASEPSTIAGP